VARSLARQQAADGEGASTLITCQVSGAADDYDARAIARSVISSSLLKALSTAATPTGPRGQRRRQRPPPDEQMLEAAGLHHTEAMPRAGRAPELDPDKLQIAIAGTTVFKGTPCSSTATPCGPRWRRRVLIRLHSASARSGEAFGCDLTEAYVVENAEYTT